MFAAMHKQINNTKVDSTLDMKSTAINHLFITSISRVGGKPQTSSWIVMFSVDIILYNGETHRPYFF